MVICWLKKWYHKREKEFLCLLNFLLLIISFKFMQHLKSYDCVVLQYLFEIIFDMQYISADG